MRLCQVVPALAQLTFDPDGIFIEMPFAGRRWPVTPDFCGEPLAEAGHSVTDCLAGNRDTSFRQKILPAPQAQSKPVVVPAYQMTGSH